MKARDAEGHPRECTVSTESITRKEMCCPSNLAIVLSRPVVYTLWSVKQPGATPVKGSLRRSPESAL